MLLKWFKIESKPRGQTSKIENNEIEGNRRGAHIAIKRLNSVRVPRKTAWEMKKEALRHRLARAGVKPT